MRRHVRMFLLTLTVAVFGLVSSSVFAFELITKTETVVVDNVEVDIIRTADNFIILFDSSSSIPIVTLPTN